MIGVDYVMSNTTIPISRVTQLHADLEKHFTDSAEYFYKYLNDRINELYLVPGEERGYIDPDTGFHDSGLYTISDLESASEAYQVLLKSHEDLKYKYAEAMATKRKAPNLEELKGYYKQLEISHEFHCRRADEALIESKNLKEENHRLANELSEAIAMCNNLLAYKDVLQEAHDKALADLAEASDVINRIYQAVALKPFDNTQIQE